MASFLTGTWRFVLVSLALGAGGCRRELPNPATPGAAPALAHTGVPLTEADGQKFGEKLEQAITSGDTAAVNNLMRPAEIVERSVSDLSLSRSESKSLFTFGAKFGESFPEQFVKVVADGGSYSFLRVRMVAGRPRVILRLMSPEGASNYHEFSLIRYPDNQVAAEDVYIYLSGEPLSHTFRRILLGILTMQQKGFTNLSKEEQTLVDHMPEISKMTSLLRRGEHAESLAIYRKLPAELQKNKFIQLVAIQAAGGSGDDNDYVLEMERFRKNHPKDAAGDLISIDYFLLKKNYDETLQAIDRLDASLGGDPYLDTLRANVFAEAGRHDEAQTAADKAVQNLPKMAQAYWTKVSVAALANNHDETLKGFQLIVEKLDPMFDLESLSNDERFVEFLKTPQYAAFTKWLAERGE